MNKAQKIVMDGGIDTVSLGIWMKHRDWNTGTGSCFADMLCDAQAQYGDYSELDECPMWGGWEKEGGEWDIGPTEKRREQGKKMPCGEAQGAVVKWQFWR